MSPIERILCPVDLSEASQHAVDHALAIAAWYGARITALHAYSTTGEGDDERLRAEVAASFRPGNLDGTPVDILVKAGHPVELILECAASLPADVIVMGTHGIGGFEHLVLGSVTEKVLRKASCPVFTVPPRALATSALPFKQILCAVDFSPSSDLALQFAFSVAEEAEAGLTLVHVLEWPWHEPPAPAFDELPHEQAVQLADFRRQREQQATEHLEALIPHAVRDSCSPVARFAHGKPYVEILRIAGEDKADLIVMGVHGHGALELTLLGSTTNQVVRRATCPVLTVRRS